MSLLNSKGREVFTQYRWKALGSCSHGHGKVKRVKRWGTSCNTHAGFFFIDSPYISSGTRRNLVIKLCSEESTKKWTRIYKYNANFPWKKKKQTHENRNTVSLLLLYLVVKVLYVKLSFDFAAEGISTVLDWSDLKLTSLEPNYRERHGVCIN